MASDTYQVERSTVIEAPAERIYPLIEDFHRWTAWSPWEGLDPNLQRTYTGPESGPGASYAWKGNRKAGAGRMEITEATPTSDVHVDLAFDKPMKQRSQVVFALVPEGEGTRVTWTLTGRRTVLSRVMPMDKLLGPSFERGLAQLKTAAEQG